MKEKIYVGKTKEQFIDWIKNRYPYTPTPGPEPDPEPEPGPTAPDGKVLYKTEAGGEWLQADASISNGTFNGLIEKGSAVEVIIPSKDANGNSVTSIGESAFEDCGRLISVTIPDSVTSIGFYAFYSCRNLTSVTIPNSITNICGAAFYSCRSLTSLTIPNRFTPNGSDLFQNCSGLTSITFNSYMKNEVKKLTTDEILFGGDFYDDEWNPMEKSFTAICTDGSMTIHFSADDPATITFTDL